MSQKRRAIISLGAQDVLMATVRRMRKKAASFERNAAVLHSKGGQNDEKWSASYRCAGRAEAYTDAANALDEVLKLLEPMAYQPGAKK